MNTAIRVTTEQLRRFLPMLHFERISRALAPLEQVLAHVDARGAIQFDPINVVGRNADLMLQSRIDGYQPQHLYDAIYKERMLYDGYDKMLCIFPVRDYPKLARIRRETYKWYRANPEMTDEYDRVLDAIRERGAICSDDLKIDKKIEWPWGPARLSRTILESLWVQGTLAVAKKEGARKYYDLAERCYPREILDAPDPHEDEPAYHQWQALRRIGSVGFVREGASDAYLGIDGFNQTARKAAIDQLVRGGQLVALQTEEGLKGYIAARDFDLIEKAAAQAPESRVRFLAPLDNLLWDRKMIARLYGFDYHWEVYTPKEKRKYGYYVLPVLFGDRFVARIEWEHFRGGTLRLKNIWWEEGVSEKTLPAGELIKAVERFATYLGASDFSMKVEG